MKGYRLAYDFQEKEKGKGQGVGGGKRNKTHRISRDEGLWKYKEIKPSLSIFDELDYFRDGSRFAHENRGGMHSCNTEFATHDI